MLGSCRCHLDQPLIAGERPSPPSGWRPSPGALVIGFTLHEGGGAGAGGLFLGALASALGYSSGKLAAGSPVGGDLLGPGRRLAGHDPGALSMPESAVRLELDQLRLCGLMSQYLGFFAWNAGLPWGIAHVSQVSSCKPFTLLIAVLNREAILWIVPASSCW